MTNLDKLREKQAFVRDRDMIIKTVEAIEKDVEEILEDILFINITGNEAKEIVRKEIKQLLNPTNTLKKSLRSGRVF